MKLPRFLPRAAVVTLLLAAYGAVVFLLSVVLLWGLGSGLRLTFFSDRGPDRSTYAGFGRSSDRQSWTTTEAAAIARQLPASRVLRLTGAAATELAVRTRAPGRAVLHFAAHTVVRDDDPFGSYLALGRSMVTGARSMSRFACCDACTTGRKSCSCSPARSI